MHDGVIQRFIVETGRLAETGDIWKNGILLRDGARRVQVQARDKKIIDVRVTPNGLDLLDKVRNLLEKLQDSPGTKSVSADGEQYVSLERLQNHPERLVEIEAEDGTWTPVGPLQVFLRRDEKAAFPAAQRPKQAPLAGQPAIYFSYAWKDDDDGVIENREKIVDELYWSLKKDGFNVVRDRYDLPYGESIEVFEAALGRGDLVAVFVSDKYLKSMDCMWEICEIFRNRRQESREFQQHILPIHVERLKLRDLALRKAYLDHWKSQFEQRDHAEKEYPHSASQFREEKNRIARIQQQFEDVVASFRDANALTLDSLSRDGFALVKQTILTRFKEINP